MSRALEGSAKGVTELLVKDMMKQLKSGLNDKAMIIKVATIEVLTVNVFIEFLILAWFFDNVFIHFILSQVHVCNS